MSSENENETSRGGEISLIRRAREGDQQAFEALITKYQDRVFRLVRRLLNNADSVEDLVQEVFIRAYRSLGAFKGEAAFYTWIYKIALNTCRNYYRSQGRKPEGSVLENEKIFDTLESRERGPEEEALRVEFWEVVRRALDGLPSDQREAVVLCDFEGLKYEDIASIAGVPVGTVRSRVFRGRRSMQTEMMPYLRKRDKRDGRVEN